MKHPQNPPINFNPAYDLQRQQVQIPIVAPFTEDESLKTISMFEEADKIYKAILEKVKRDSYPFMVHCLSIPQFASSCYLQGVSVQRIQQDQVRPPTTEICLELSRTENVESGIIYIPYASVLYLAIRATDVLPTIVIVDNLLERYAKKV